MTTTHLHLLLNHVPVIGTAIGLLILLMGYFRKSDELKKAALILFTLATLVAVPTYLTGEPAEEAVESLPGVTKAVIEKHEEAAVVAFTGVVVLGVLSLGGLLRYRQGRMLPPWFTSATIVASLIVCGLMAWTANLGGQIRHTEIRSSSGPSSYRSQH
jgi:uncharacterized membrane protein